MCNDHAIRCLRSLILLVLTVAFSVVSGSADISAQTVTEILNNKKIVIGVNQDFPPFAFVNDQQQPDGFNIELARLVGKYMGVDVELKQVAAVNRIPYLLTKQVDMLVASLGVTPERAKQVMFTIPCATTYTEVIATKSKMIKSLSDLSNLKVAVGRSSSNDMFITQLAPRSTNIMRFEGESAAAQALLSGQVDALAMSNVMSARIMRDNPQLQLESKFVVRSQYDAMTVRKDAFELHEWLNAFIYYIKVDGELDTLYQKWIGTPLPELPTF